MFHKVFYELWPRLFHLRTAPPLGVTLTRYDYDDRHNHSENDHPDIDRLVTIYDYNDHHDYDDLNDLNDLMIKIIILMSR